MKWSTDESVWVRSDDDWPKVKDPVTGIEAPLIPEHQGLLTGMPSGNICVLDVDNKRGTPYQQVLDWLSSTWNLSPETTLACATKSGGMHLYIQVPAEQGTLNNRANMPVPDIDGPSGLDFRGTGGYVNIPPTPGYTWLNDLTPLVPPPEFFEWFRSSSNSQDDLSATDVLYKALQGELTEGERNDLLFKLASKLAYAFRAEPETTAVSLIHNNLLTAANNTKPPYRGQKEDEELLSMAQRAYTYIQNKLSQPAPVPSPAAQTATQKTLFTQQLLQSYNPQTALELPADRLGFSLRIQTLQPQLIHIPSTGWWYKDRVWKHIHENLLFQQLIPVFSYIEQEELKAGAEAKHVARLRACYGNDSSPMMKALADVFSQPYVDFDNPEYRRYIGFTNGVYDLQDHTFTDEAPEGTYPTTYFEYEYSATLQATPYWDKIVMHLSGGDKETFDFIHTLLGYALLGTNPESKFILLIGAAAAGKSAFINACLSLFSGSAGATLPAETFTRNTSEGSRGSHLFRAMSARFVSIPEVGAAQVLDIEQIKKLTGNDTITARLLYSREQFEFKAGFLPFMVGNIDPPFYESSSLAIRRRFIKIPVNHSLPSSERIPHIDELVLNERPYIMNKLLQYLKQYQESSHTLDDYISARAHQATIDMLDGQDLFKSFIENECVLDPMAYTYSMNLTKAMQAYVQEVEGFSSTPSSRSLKRRLLEIDGIRQHRHKFGQRLVGIRLKNPSESPTGMALRYDMVRGSLDVTFYEQAAHDDNNQPLAYYKPGGDTQAGLKVVKS